MKTLESWVLAALMAAVLVLGAQLDGPTDVQAAQDVADDVTAAIQTAQISAGARQ